MFFRKLMLKMTIDFEHYLKVKLINDSQNNEADDGYLVVQKFLETHSKLRDSLTNNNTILFYNRTIFDK